jgi:WS/DGAT/MGAT family acyltransferase
VTISQNSVSPDPARLAAWSAGHELSDAEALMWRAEADARLRSDVVLLCLLDRAPDAARLAAAHAAHVRAVPRFRQRVVDDPLRLARPRWQQTQVDLGYHLTRCQLPSGGGEAELLELAAALHMAPFDPARPLWQAVLVEGLPDGIVSDCDERGTSEKHKRTTGIVSDCDERGTSEKHKRTTGIVSDCDERGTSEKHKRTTGKAAYLLKLHHAITDGASGVALFDMLLATGPEPSDEPVLPTIEATTPLPDRTESLRAIAGLVRDGGVLAVRALARPSAAVAYARSLRRVLNVPGTPSPLLNRRGLARRLRILECPRDDLRAAAKAAGGSLNDVYLAALLGGLGHYHAKNGVPVGDLPIALPVSTRKPDDPAGGNKFTAAYIAGPVGEADPLRRVALVRERVQAVREEPALDFVGATAGLLSRLPAAVLTPVSVSMAGRLALQASNVPGLTRPVYLAGARIERMYPFGPVPGCAIMAVMLTHAGTCCITLATDHEAVPDPDLLLECVRQGLDEILALGR